MHVLLHCSLGDPELAGDAGVRTALGHQREHVAFACREVLEEVVTLAGVDQALDEGGVYD